VSTLEPNSASTAMPESSDRSFGLVFAAVFAIVGGLPLVHAGAPQWWAFGVSALFALLASARPAILRPLNRAWLMLGRLLHRLVSPLVMSAIFFLCVTPTGWILRLRGKDVLSLRRRRDLSTYWIKRDPAAPAPDTMKRQF
jgi:hypothetical protein